MRGHTWPRNSKSEVKLGSHWEKDSVDILLLRTSPASIVLQCGGIFQLTISLLDAIEDETRADGVQKNAPCPSGLGLFTNSTGRFGSMA